MVLSSRAFSSFFVYLSWLNQLNYDYKNSVAHSDLKKSFLAYVNRLIPSLTLMDALWACNRLLYGEAFSEFYSM